MLPGIGAVPVAGHTPASHLITSSAQGQRLIYRGDLLEHQGRLCDAGIHFTTGIDRPAAQRARARARTFEQALSQDIVLVTVHPGDPVFQRIGAPGTWLDATSARGGEERARDWSSC